MSTKKTKTTQSPPSVGATSNAGIRAGREDALSSRLKSAIMAIKKTGVDSFVLGMADGELVTTHVEHMPARRMSQIAISLFNQVMDGEINSPHLSKEQKELFAELQLRFKDMLREHNARMGQITSREQE